MHAAWHVSQAITVKILVQIFTADLLVIINRNSPTFVVKCNINFICIKIRVNIHTFHGANTSWLVHVNVLKEWVIEKSRVGRDVEHHFWSPVAISEFKTYDLNTYMLYSWNMNALKELFISALRSPNSCNNPHYNGHDDDTEYLVLSF